MGKDTEQRGVTEQNRYTGRGHFMADHHHTTEEERRIREAALDETVEASFPASDPPSSLPNPDEHDAPDSGAVRAGDNGQRDRAARDDGDE
jgi:hypothetical protein